MTNLNNFKLEIDADGIATFLFDVPGRTMNTFTASAVDDLERIADVLARPDVTGGVLASGKANAFCAGADLMEMDDTISGEVESQDAAYARSHRMSLLLRKVETCGKPVAAALEGLALGGGFEFALAAHYRTASPRAKVGLPEVTIGLLPGGGGTQRTPRLAGVEAALDLMLTGKPVDAERAHKLGLVDELTAPGEAVTAAKAWVRTCEDPTAPWDRKGWVMPGGPYTPQGNAGFVARPARSRPRATATIPPRRISPDASMKASACRWTSRWKSRGGCSSPPSTPFRPGRWCACSSTDRRWPGVARGPKGCRPTPSPRRRCSARG